MRALLIEDDPAALRGIEMTLKSAGFAVDTSPSGEDGLGLGKVYDYDIIILDLNLPDLSGHEVLRRLRSGGRHTPLLVLSGLVDVNNKVRSLVTGADDYLTKPFAREELVARARAVIRRARGYSHPVMEIGKISVDLERKSVEVAHAPVHLTGKEYQIFELLCLRKGMTLTKEMFLDHLYGGMDEPEVKIIDVFICKLRKKLAAATGGKHYIETVWGRGYVLRVPAESAEDSSGAGAPPARRAIA